MNLRLFTLFALIFSSTTFAKLTEEEADKLMKKAGCVACHGIKEAKIGPSYEKVAERYAKMEDSTKKYLEGKSAKDHIIHKVRNGSMKQQNWKKDDGTPYGMMPPTPAGRISDEDLGKLVDFILALKK